MTAKQVGLIIIVFISSFSLQAGNFLFGDDDKKTEKLEKRIDSLESEMAAIKVKVDSLSTQMSRIIAIFKEIKRLEGYQGFAEIDTLDNSGFSGFEDIRNRLDALDKRLALLENGSNPQSQESSTETLPKNPEETEIDTVTDRNVDLEDEQNLQTEKSSFRSIQDYYQEARNYHKQGNYEAAIKSFRKVIEQDSTSNLADNAQFWIGACYNSMEQFDRAIVEFIEVLTYSNSNKKDDALYNMGRSYRSLGNKEKARTIFQRLIDEYPDSEFVNLAIKQMKEL
ncbi:MAG: tol-pal system protein YbgF [Candidatus Marinimicrobia bacterium]|nr:tol-pal system protein YbgF [Candidatus Neomarinimicrobiota bacterium]